MLARKEFMTLKSDAYYQKLGSINVESIGICKTIDGHFHPQVIKKNHIAGGKVHQKETLVPYVLVEFFGMIGDQLD